MLRSILHPWRPPANQSTRAAAAIQVARLMSTLASGRSNEMRRALARCIATIAITIAMALPHAATAHDPKSSDAASDTANVMKIRTQDVHCWSERPIRTDDISTDVARLIDMLETADADMQQAMVRMELDESGKAEYVTLVQSSKIGSLDALALRLALQPRILCDGVEPVTDVLGYFDFFRDATYNSTTKHVDIKLHLETFFRPNSDDAPKDYVDWWCEDKGTRPDGTRIVSCPYVGACGVMDYADMPLPIYNSRLLDKGIYGVSTVRVELDPKTAKVLKTTVIKSSGVSEFDVAARDSLANTKFKCQGPNPKPYVESKFHFTLQYN